MGLGMNSKGHSNSAREAYKRAARMLAYAKERLAAGKCGSAAAAHASAVDNLGQYKAHMASWRKSWAENDKHLQDLQRLWHTADRIASRIQKHCGGPSYS